MNDNILRAIESLCDDIATNVNAEDNQKRANAILALALGGIVTPEETEEDCCTDNDTTGAGTATIKFPKPGEHFEYNGIEFVALGEEQGGVLAVVAEKLEERMAFDKNNKNDWRCSTLRKYLNDEYINKFDTHDLLPFVSDLTSDDGMTDYGTTEDYIFLLSCDLYRKYRKCMPQYDTWVWTVTPWTCNPSHAYYARIVYSSGGLNYTTANLGIGVAPACLFNPKIFE